MPQSESPLSSLIDRWFLGWHQIKKSDSLIIPSPKTETFTVHASKNTDKNQSVLFKWPTNQCLWESLLFSVCVCVWVCVTHAGAQAAWQARPPFGWLASRREHGRGRKWSLAAGSRKDWKSSSPAMNRHRDTKHGSQKLHDAPALNPNSPTPTRLTSPCTHSIDWPWSHLHAVCCTLCAASNTLMHRPVELWKHILEATIHQMPHTLKQALLCSTFKL